jgi:predicted Co/Zn/Cd cation transporter (cation efflux family)
LPEWVVTMAAACAAAFIVGWIIAFALDQTRNH